MLPRHKCYGSATVGERGQVVIPAEARAELEIKAGDKLIFFGVGRGGMMLMKASEMAEFVQKAITQLTDLKTITENEVKETE